MQEHGNGFPGCVAFDGRWMDSEESVVTIEGRKLTGDDGVICPFIVEHDVCYIEVEETVHKGCLSADRCKLQWSDGFTWTKLGDCKQSSEEYQRAQHSQEVLQLNPKQAGEPVEMPHKFEGCWQDAAGSRIIISGNAMYGASGESARLELVAEDVCSIQVDGQVCRGVLDDNGRKVIWSDGDSWVKVNSLHVPPMWSGEEAAIELAREAQEIRKKALAEAQFLANQRRANKERERERAIAESRPPVRGPTEGDAAGGTLERQPSRQSLERQRIQAAAALRARQGQAELEATRKQQVAQHPDKEATVERRSSQGPQNTASATSDHHAAEELEAKRKQAFEDERRRRREAVARGKARSAARKDRETQQKVHELDEACCPLLSSGLKVKIKGLESQPALNGQVGSIVKKHEEKKRWQVLLDDGSRTLLLKEQNIEPATMLDNEPAHANA